MSRTLLWGTGYGGEVDSKLTSDFASLIFRISHRLSNSFEMTRKSFLLIDGTRVLIITIVMM